MSSATSYEFVSELHHSAVTTVYTVRAKGSPDILAMKSYETEHLTVQEKTVFLDQVRNSIQVQQKVASIADSHWAVIHDFGGDDKPFYVTDEYTQSLQNLLAMQNVPGARIKIHHNTLYQIVLAVLSGLHELKTTCNRPHGNLKPSNVLIKPLRDKNKFKVVLTDPLADSLVRQQDWQNDLRFVCDMIYQLVTGQNIPDMQEWRVQKDPHWKHLGKLGEGWISACNTLLTIAPEKQAADIEAVLAALPIKKSNKPLITKVILGLALLGLIECCLWGYGWYKQRQIDNAPPASGQWRMLMDTYYGPWGRRFAQELQERKSDPKFQQKWDTAGLGLILKKETFDFLTYPAQVAEKANYVVSEYEQWKTAALDKNATTKETLNAINTYTRITDLFNPSNKNYWEYLKNIEKQKKVFAAWQCDTAIEQLLENANPQQPDSIAGIDRVLTIYRPLLDCVSAYGKLPDNMEQPLAAALNKRVAKTLLDNFSPEALDDITGNLFKPVVQTLAVAKEALQEKENHKRCRDILDALIADLETEGPKAIRKATADLEELIITWDKLQRDIANSRPEGKAAQQLWEQWKNAFERNKTQKENNREWLKTAKAGYIDFKANIIAFQQSIDNPDNHSIAGPDSKWQSLYTTLKSSRQDTVIREIQKAVETGFLESAPLAKRKGDEFAGYLVDLKGRFTILQKIETALADYYLPDEIITADSNQSLESLQNDFLKGIFPELLNATEVKQLLDDIAAFGRIKQMTSGQELVIVLTSNPDRFKPVHQYAAWKRLGHPDADWPWKDKQGMLAAYDTLKKEVQANLVQEPRRQSVLAVINEVAAENLKKYLGIQTAALEQNLSVLKESDEHFNSLILEPFKEAINNKIKTFSQTFKSQTDVSTMNTQLDTDWAAFRDQADRSIEIITSLVNSTQWNNNPDCRKDLFSQDMKAEWDDKKQWTPAFLETWKQNLGLYHLFPDPRDTIVAKDIDARIETEAEPAEKDGIRREMNTLIADIQASQTSRPAIQKNHEFILDAEKQFRDRYNTIDQKLTPKWCGYLTWDDKTSQLRFKPDILPGFEPVALSEGIDSDIFSKKKWAAIADRIHWRDLRKKQEPFFSPEGFEESKPSWPKYIRSVKQPSVIFRFVPADKPFYIGIREVTFGQVPEIRKYYQRKITDPPRWTGFGNISQEKYPYPFVYITAENARKYAESLGGRLPTSTEHRYVSDWVNANETSFHLTSAAALDKVIKTYNYYAANKEATTSGQFWEVGVIQIADRSNDAGVSIYQKCFPEICSKSDPKGLYDILGNVWEWCYDPDGSTAICGYSSLTPKEFCTDKIHYSLKEKGSDRGYNWDVNPQNTYSDVGFRIAVDVPNIP